MKDKSPLSPEDAAILKELQKLPNIGRACAKDLLLLGITDASQLKEREADEMFEELCAKTGQRHDPCMRDTLESAISFAQGNPAQPWWHFTEGRKERDRSRKT